MIAAGTRRFSLDDTAKGHDGLQTSSERYTIDYDAVREVTSSELRRLSVRNGESAVSFVTISITA